MTLIFWLTMLGLALLFGAGCGFLIGIGYEHSRTGGTADLQDRIRTVTRLRPVRDPNSVGGLGRGVSR